jgi:hypothetical protein
MRPAIRPTSERVYTAVKAQLLSGAFLPGERIDAAQLAVRHGASITPVRAALHHLAGERLVEARAGEGFHAPRVTEAGLRDLYAWNGHVLQLAWRLDPQTGGLVGRRGLAVDGDLESLDLVAGTERLFAAVGGRSGNAPCAEAIDGLNDRLHLARGLEGRLFTDAADELTKLTDVLASGQSSDIRQAITHYHRRRMRAAPELVRLMHQRRDPP